MEDTGATWASNVFEIHAEDKFGWVSEGLADAKARFKRMTPAERLHLLARSRSGIFNAGNPNRNTFDPILFDPVLFPTEGARLVYIAAFMDKLLRMLNSYRSRRAELNQQQGSHIHEVVQRNLQHLHWSPRDSAERTEQLREIELDARAKAKVAFANATEKERARKDPTVMSWWPSGFNTIAQSTAALREQNLFREAFLAQWLELQTEHLKKQQEVEAPKTPVPTVRKSFSRRFVLNRHHDITGTSGTGIVAEGVVFSCGKVALTWFSHYGAVNNYDTIEVVKVLHGHDGNTRIEWLDEEAA